MIQAKELKKYALLRILVDLKQNIFIETCWYSKYKMLQKRMCIRSDLIDDSSHKDSNIKINNSITYQN